MSDIIRESTAVDVIASIHGVEVEGAQYDIVAPTREAALDAANALAEAFNGTMTGHTYYDRTVGGFYTVTRKPDATFVLAHVRHSDSKEAAA